MRTLIGMSGGVDSSVAAYLMQQKGYECVGGTMLLYTGNKDGKCCSEDNVRDAKSVADRMGIDFHVFDLSQEFDEKVMSDFVGCYLKGLTPNPCVQCNRHLKFGKFLEQARKIGCQSIVTGHYAQIAKLENGRYCLKKAVDEAKDQTYFLYTMDQEQLSHTHFPLGELTKAEAREIAQEQGFINAKKRDSQDICFIPDGDYLAFLEEYTGKKSTPGNFLDKDGKVIGKHKGAAGYTLGQRKGLGIAMGQPVYVTGKDMAANTVTIGFNEELFKKELLANDVNWMAIAAPSEPVTCKAKARSRMIEQPVTIYPQEDGSVKVVFDEPQRAITPGQAVVFYQDDLVLGGGTILEAL